MAPSGECLRDKSPPDQMLAKPWRRLFLASFGLNLVVVAVLRDRLLRGWVLCLNHNKEDYYYYQTTEYVGCSISDRHITHAGNRKTSVAFKAKLYEPYTNFPRYQALIHLYSCILTTDVAADKREVKSYRHCQLLTATTHSVMRLQQTNRFSSSIMHTRPTAWLYALLS